MQMYDGDKNHLSNYNTKFNFNTYILKSNLLPPYKVSS